jgi:hypothetical protein
MAVKFFSTENNNGNCEGGNIEVYKDDMAITDALKKLIFKGDVDLNSQEEGEVSVEVLGGKKSNYNAIVPPTGLNDLTQGYVVGSRWIDKTQEKEYVCVDNSAGNAIWIETTVRAGSADLNVKQVTKLNVKATPDNPHVIEIPIPYTNVFKKLPIEVLKLEGEEKEVTETVAQFDNADATDFEPNEFVEFDGTMHLKTDYVFDTEVVNEEDGIYSFDLNKLDAFKDLIDIKCI